MLDYDRLLEDSLIELGYRTQLVEVGSWVGGVRCLILS